MKLPKKLFVRVSVPGPNKRADRMCASGGKQTLWRLASIMGSDAEYWLEVGRRLGIEVIAPVTVNLSGVEARLTALLPQFGGTAGMVVDADWSAIAPHVSALSAAGYGYSCVPAGDANVRLPFEMLADWGWTSAQAEPEWLRG